MPSEQQGPSPARPVRWGIISTASIAVEKVVPAMMRSEWCDVRAIASRSRDTARAAADRLGIPVAYGSYEELLDDPVIEAVYNPLPNHLHVPMTLAAAAKGKHVLCEKPIAMTAAEAERLREAPPGILIAEAFMVRHHPQWARARELVRAGRLGEVRTVQVIFSFHNVDPRNVRNIAEAGGGALYDVGCYAIALSRYVFGAEPLRVVALVDRDPRFGTDRLTSALLDFGDGRHGSFTVGTQLRASQSATIVGGEGRLDLALPFTPARDGARLRLDLGPDAGEPSPATIELPEAHQHELQGRNFSLAVRGERPLEFGVADAILQMRAIDALFRSERSGAWEQV